MRMCFNKIYILSMLSTLTVASVKAITFMRGKVFNAHSGLPNFKIELSKCIRKHRADFHKI